MLSDVLLDIFPRFSNFGDVAREERSQVAGANCRDNSVI
jgi:hypothetical protein